MGKWVRPLELVNVTNWIAKWQKGPRKIIADFRSEPTALVHQFKNGAACFSF